MNKRKESFWFEGLKYAEDEVQLVIAEGDIAHESYYQPPSYALVSDKNQEEFFKGYFDAIAHYKQLGMVN